MSEIFEPTEGKADGSTGIIPNLNEIDMRGKYRIDIMFVAPRTINGRNKVTVSAWEGGFDRSGDMGMFWCRLVDDKGDGPIKRSGFVGHNLPIPFPETATNNAIYCPYCKAVHPTDELGPNYYFNTTMRPLAGFVARAAQALKLDTDIVAYYHESDLKMDGYRKTIAVSPRDEAATFGVGLYRMETLMKDVNAGKAPADAILGFLRA